MFDRLIHADWSTHAGGRMACVAERRRAGWTIGAPFHVGESRPFLDRLFDDGAHTLAGFDFPIGAPRAWGLRTGLDGFVHLLTKMDAPPWHRLAEPCETAGEISLHWPFYPRSSRAGTRRDDLVRGLDVARFEDLLRDCERGGDGRRAGCALFWTLGANQVGRAALHGWREILRPARARGARLWPFDGDLAELACGSAPVIAETYPADALRTLGVPIPAGFSKRRPADRSAAATALLERLPGLEGGAMRLTDAAHAALVAGFGPRADGEDAFDAMTGALAMIATLGRVVAGGESRPDRVWEGGILGR